MELIFERSKKGHRMDLFPASDVPSCSRDIPLREKPLNLPQLDEVEFDRHYGELEKQTFGVNHGFYPLGSCTMKYNPAVNEVTASLSGFTDIHPLAPEASVQGALEMMYTLQAKLKVIAGMDGFTLQPAAGAHGEYTGLLLIRSYHLSRGDTKRNKIIVPDSAHGTNPASAAMAGYQVVSVPSNAEGGVDLEKLKEAVGEDTAGLMLTNPNTLGIFDPNILEITRIVHEAGGLCYYDGANLNAIVGRARPGDMGFGGMQRFSERLPAFADRCERGGELPFGETRPFFRTGEDVLRQFPRHDPCADLHPDARKRWPRRSFRSCGAECELPHAPARAAHGYRLSGHLHA